MGVSLPGGGGGGRGKNLAMDLNLVPFIDLLSVCITFLMVTAVWTQLSTMQVDQAIQDPNTPPPPPEEIPPPPMRLHIRADGVWVGRFIADTRWGVDQTLMKAGKNYPLIAEEYDWESVETDLEADRDQFATETTAFIFTDDGVSYEHMIAGLDLSRKVGYDKQILGGGPATVAQYVQ